MYITSLTIYQWGSLWYFSKCHYEHQGACIPLSYYFCILWVNTRRVIAESQSISIFNTLSILQTVFQRICISLYTDQQCKTFPLSPHHCPHLLFPMLCLLGVMTGGRSYLSLTLFCIWDVSFISSSAPGMKGALGGILCPQFYLILDPQLS